MQNPSYPNSIGVFDSGVGGLSVLRALIKEMRNTHFIYIADFGFGPYGEQPSAYIVERSQQLSHFLLRNFSLDLIVLACNTATAAAAKVLRSIYPHFSFVGIEPAIKPAAQQSGSGNIGVMATASTLSSATFAVLRTQLETLYPRICFQTVACSGLAKAVEEAFLSGDLLVAQALAKKYLVQLSEIDTLVLGCTHYPFLKDFLQETIGLQVHIVEPSVAVALQSKRVILEGYTHVSRSNNKVFGLDGLVCTPLHVTVIPIENGNACTFLSTSKKPQDIALLQAACTQWLGVKGQCDYIE